MPRFARIVRLIATTTTAGAVLAAAAAPAFALSGPDVASWQHPSGGAIAWSKVRAAGQSFVFIKATEGTNYRNPFFASDWSASHTAGLLHGAYHFARPSSAGGSAAAQARNFVSATGLMHARGDLPPSLDLEDAGGLGSGPLITWVSTWLSTVHQLTGRTPMIYSAPYFWQAHMASTSALRAYPLWGACYCSAPTTFGGAWRTWTFWQYTSTSTIAGISGRVDSNQFNGTAAQLASLANGAVIAPPAPKPVVVKPGTVAPTAVTAAAPNSAGPWVSFTVAGRLTSAGRSVAAKQLQVRIRMLGTTDWRYVRTVTTDANGHYETHLHAPASVQVSTKWAGSSTLAPSQSPVRTITVTA